MDIVINGYEDNFVANSTVGMVTEESSLMSAASTLAYVVGMGSIMVLTLKNLMVPEPTGNQRHRGMPPAAFSTAAKTPTDKPVSEETAEAPAEAPVEAGEPLGPEDGSGAVEVQGEDEYTGGDVRRLKGGAGKVSRPPSSGTKTKNKDAWDAGKHWKFGDSRPRPNKPNKNKWRLGERHGSDEENWRSASPVPRRLLAESASPGKEAAPGSPLRPKRLSPNGSNTSSPLSSPISSRDSTPISSRPKPDCQGKWRFGGERGREQGKWKERPKHGSPSPTAMGRQRRGSEPTAGKSRLAGERTRSDSDSWRETAKEEALAVAGSLDSSAPEKPTEEWTTVAPKKTKGKSR